MSHPTPSTKSAEAQYILYEQVEGGPTFRGMKSDTPPKWAINIRDEVVAPTKSAEALPELPESKFNDWPFSDTKLYTAEQVQACILADRATRAAPVQSVGEDERFKEIVGQLATRALHGENCAANMSTLIAHIDSLLAARTGSAAPEKLAVELEGVHQQVEDGAGFWHTCSGCHDTEDGHPTGNYNHSSVFNCALGTGCHECGGLGACWDNNDYSEEEAAPTASPPQAEPVSPVGAVYQFRQKVGAGDWIECDSRCEERMSTGPAAICFEYRTLYTTPPAVTAPDMPTNDEVYAEVCRQRGDSNLYVSTNAINDTMAAIRTLTAAPDMSARDSAEPYFCDQCLGYGELHGENCPHCNTLEARALRSQPKGEAQ